VSVIPMLCATVGVELHDARRRVLFVPPHRRRSRIRCVHALARSVMKCPSALQVSFVGFACTCYQVVYLASERAGHVSGTVLTVDRGATKRK
jgi:hypothetical protein